MGRTTNIHIIFLSTPSARRATTLPVLPCAVYGYFYPRPPRGGRRFQKGRPHLQRGISIHALREEGDVAVLRAELERDVISIHALREEGDDAASAIRYSVGDFYPRPPRGGRPARTAAGTASHNFYPRPPRGGRPDKVGGDVAEIIFLSTPSARRATVQFEPERAHRRHFYPRPPRGGRPLSLLALSSVIDFYPRPPRGGRPLKPSPHSKVKNFYPRPPRGGRHRRPPPELPTACISIHALREEGDLWEAREAAQRKDFYPRPPRGGRPQSRPACDNISLYFYPRPPRGGRRPSTRCCGPC